MTKIILSSESRVSGWIQILRPGDNVIAIHGMNQTASSSDLLFQAQVFGNVYNTQTPGSRIYWRAVPQ